MSLFSQMQKLGFLFKDTLNTEVTESNEYKNRPGDLELHKETVSYLTEKKDRSLEDLELKRRLDEKASAWKGVDVDRFLSFAPKKYSTEEIYGKAVLRSDYDPLTKTKEEIEYEKRYNKNLELSNKLYQKEIEMEKLMGGRYPNPLYPSTIGHKNKKISDTLDHYALGSMMSSASQGYIPSSRDLGMGEKNVFLAPTKESGLGAYAKQQEERVVNFWGDPKYGTPEKVKEKLTDINVPWGVYYGHAKRDKGLGEGIFSGVEYRDLATQSSKFIKNEKPLIEYYRNNKGWSDEKIRDVVVKHELIHRAMTTSGFFPSSVETGSYLKENFEDIDWNDANTSHDMQEAMTRAYTNKISNNGKLDLKQLDVELAPIFENVKTRKLIMNKYLPLFDKAFDNYLSEVGTGISSSKLNQRKSKSVIELSDRKSQIAWIRKRFEGSDNEINKRLPKNEIEKIKINRAIRNNNPFNMNYTTIDWDGKLERDVSIEPRFERFESPLMGMRAGIINTLTHHLNYGDDTIEKLITRHAPPTENDTESFINFVSKKMNIKPNEKIDLTKDYMLVKYAKAVTLFEGFDNYYEGTSLIYDAVEMAYKQKGIK